MVFALRVIEGFRNRLPDSQTTPPHGQNSEGAFSDSFTAHSNEDTIQFNTIQLASSQTKSICNFER